MHILRISQIPRLLLTFLFIGLIISPSQSLRAETSVEASLNQKILNTMNQLITKLKQNKSEYAEDENLFYQELNDELSRFINFKRIALKVMGKHVRRATKEERDSFILVFKRSLYQAYAAVLLDNDNVQVKVLGSVVNERNPGKAKTNLEIISGNGTKYPLSYSLHKEKDQVFRVENIVVMGVNIGLSFRDRFQQQMKIHRGSIKGVIENWSSEGLAQSSSGSSST
jgi:phospholipid transport system substrate-binding protein